MEDLVGFVQRRHTLRNIVLRDLGLTGNEQSLLASLGLMFLDLLVRKDPVACRKQHLGLLQACIRRSGDLESRSFA